MNGEPSDLDLLLQVPDPFSHEAAPLPSLPSRPSHAPTRAQHRRRSLAAAIVALFLQVGWIVAWRRPLGPEMIRPHIALDLGLPLAGAIFLWIAASHRGNRGLGVRTAWLGTEIAAVSLIFIVATLAFAPAGHARSADAFLGAAIPCIVASGVLCAVSLGLCALAFRRAFAAASTWRTAVLGTACGALTTATMSLACSNATAMHLLLAHGWIILVGGAIGALLGRHFTRT